MFAEVTVTAAEALPGSLEEQARDWFKPLALPRTAAALPGFRGRSGLVVSAMLVKMSSTYTALLFRHDAHTLKAHVELHPGFTELRHLKKVAEETADRLGNLVSAQGTSVKSIDIRLICEGGLLETGQRHSWSRRLGDAARKEVGPRLSAPVATFLASLAMGSDVQRAAVNTAAAVIGVVIWLLASATLDRAEYKYE